MQNWRQILQKSVTQPEQLGQDFSFDHPPLKAVAAQYPMRINSYYRGLIKKVGDPLWLQAVPDRRELEDDVGLVDPLAEENLSPVPNLVHKYPDRVLFLVSAQCAVYCRFCTRKRKVGKSAMAVNRETVAAGLEYIRKTPGIRDVLLSGGDPLLLEDTYLEWLLAELRKIPSVEIIRIGTRVPCTLPMRVTVRLAAVLKRFHPLFINTHFNHPDELTPEAGVALRRLANAGIPLNCQTVLLKGVNDQPDVLKRLFLTLLQHRVQPYYLFQTDLTRGTNHFRTPVETGLDILQSLIGFTSGMAIPTFAIDAPGGNGKIPLLPNYVQSLGKNLVFRNYLGKLCHYPNGC